MELKLEGAFTDYFIVLLIMRAKRERQAITEGADNFGRPFIQVSVDNRDSVRFIFTPEGRYVEIETIKNKGV